jgi:mevalonate kinase
MISSPAKWILCGEHSVRRGGKAIAFPLRNFSASIFFKKSDDLFIEDCYSKDTILTLLKKGCEFLDVPLKKIYGHIRVQSNIPTESGLGSSAALCCGIAKLFRYCGCCGCNCSDDVSETAKHLENEFHRQSSGLDVAVILANKPIIFNENKVAEFLKPKFWPHMLITYSGEKSLTSDCVRIADNFFLTDEKAALEADRLMNSATDMCEEAFKNADFDELRDGIMLGNEIFRRWGLHTAATSLQLEKLLSAGAVAAKPIGSGLGGYILSLWKECPCVDSSLLLTTSSG